VPKLRPRVPTRTVDFPPNRHWIQSFPFSCGPAALGSVLTALDWTSSRGRPAEQLTLWREVTAVACPGAHPLGLALAARRRGFSSEVRVDGARPWLNEHSQRSHRLLRSRDYSRVERYLLRECQDLGIPVRWGAVSPREAQACLLLVTNHGRPAAEPDPHWVGLVPSVKSVWVSDPLRRRPYRSRRSLREWWDVSGFDGTKSWVGIWKGGASHPKPSFRSASDDSRPRGSDWLRSSGARKHR
jgi:Peptidase_C39 like family